MTDSHRNTMKQPPFTHSNATISTYHWDPLDQLWLSLSSSHSQCHSPIPPPLFLNFLPHLGAVCVGDVVGSLPEARGLSLRILSCPLFSCQSHSRRGALECYSSWLLQKKGWEEKHKTTLARKAESNMIGRCFCDVRIDLLDSSVPASITHKNTAKEKTKNKV